MHHTQKEHRDVAHSTRDILIGQFPAFAEALTQIYKDDEDGEVKAQ